LRIEGVQVGMPARVAGTRTAFGKRPLTGRVRVHYGHLEGDAQADRRYHGGPDMAVLAYGADHYPAWREELHWPDLPLGGFGENLSVSGASEETACIGDVWRAGSALLQIASPRRPCEKISAYWRRPDLLTRVQGTGRIGWYLRVIEEGWLETGQEIHQVASPHAAFTVRRAFQASRDRGGEEALRVAGVPALSERWRRWLRGEPARV
jgi:MOSC domain-containing protein YiiM